MRPIKFKAKRFDTGKWVYGFPSTTIALPDMEKVECIQATEYNKDGTVDRIMHWQIIPSTLCQFTGLYDKNGKEIYESDIIETYQHSPYDKYGKNPSVDTVIWDSEQMGFTPFIDQVSYDGITHIEAARYFIVIGNIHDKEEL